MPFPTPGQPKNTHCTFLSDRSRFLAAADDEKVIAGEGVGDEKPLAGDLEAAEVAEDLRRRWRTAMGEEIGGGSRGRK